MRRPRKSMAEINVVPYIDVMLVLLIIFMVTAHIQPGEIDLPNVGQALAPTIATLEVRIKKDGSIVIADLQQGGQEQAVTRETLLRAVRAVQANRPDQAVVISADRNIKYEDVVRVLDVLQGGKIKRVGLLTKPLAR